MHPEGASLHQLVRILRRRVLVLLLPVIIVPAFAAAYSLSQDKEYTTEASLLFRATPGSDVKLSPADDEEREAATNVSLASLNRVGEQTAQVLGPPSTPGLINGSVEIVEGGSSNIVGVKATNEDPRLAARIANTYAQQFVEFRRSADRAVLLRAQRTATRRLSSINSRLTELASAGIVAPASEEARSLRRTRAQLRESLQNFSAAAALVTGNVELVERAQVPGSPSTPKLSQTIALGLGLGLLLGLALVVLFELLDRRLGDPEEAAAILRRPVLGAIPLSPALARDRRTPRDPLRLRPGDREAFQMLRANLHYFDFEEPVRSVVVTSAAPGDGKSTVAWNLAAAAANVGHRALLVEAELRRPSFVREFHVGEADGLTEVLAGQSELWDVVRQLPVGPAADGQGVPTMDIIVAGNVPPNPTDLLESGRMRQLLEELEQAYDLVVIDTPPVSVVSDAIPLLRHADGILIVTRVGKTTRDAAGHLRKQLDGLNARVLGVVVNGISSQDGYYGSAQSYDGGYTDLPVSRP